MTVNSSQTLPCFWFISHLSLYSRNSPVYVFVGDVLHSSALWFWFVSHVTRLMSGYVSSNPSELAVKPNEICRWTPWLRPVCLRPMLFFFFRCNVSYLRLLSPDFNIKGQVFLMFLQHTILKIPFRVCICFERNYSPRLHSFDSKGIYNAATDFYFKYICSFSCRGQC